MPNADGDADRPSRLDKIAEHVTEACYLAHQERDVFLAHLLKMVLVELQYRGAYGKKPLSKL
ncbi:MAG: hypothetical protein EOO23_07080 [Comamonadaceae bacterium]|nr:MAG: hypothetical protein EOO23_07080 [Comamonadaceae bacterium]